MEGFDRVLTALEEVDPLLQTVQSGIYPGNIYTQAADLGLHAADAKFQFGIARTSVRSAASVPS